jgi:hypothetical protein
MFPRPQTLRHSRESVRVAQCDHSRKSGAAELAGVDRYAAKDSIGLVY